MGRMLLLVVFLVIAACSCWKCVDVRVTSLTTVLLISHLNLTSSITFQSQHHITSHHQQCRRVLVLLKTTITTNFHPRPLDRSPCWATTANQRPNRRRPNRSTRAARCCSTLADPHPCCPIHGPQHHLLNPSTTTMTTTSCLRLFLCFNPPPADVVARTRLAVTSRLTIMRSLLRFIRRQSCPPFAPARLSNLNNNNNNNNSPNCVFTRLLLLLLSLRHTPFALALARSTVVASPKRLFLLLPPTRPSRSWPVAPPSRSTSAT